MIVNLDRVPYWIICTAIASSLLLFFRVSYSDQCGDCESFAKYDVETQIMTLPVVGLAGERFAVTLQLLELPGSSTGIGFELVTVEATEQSAIQPAAFNPNNGMVSIPRLKLVEEGNIDNIVSIELKLMEGTSPERFALTAVTQNARNIFRHETYGNEQFWTDTLRMHEVIESSVSPLTALSVGLKVDASVLPPGILDNVDLNDPATTVALLELDAVVGLKGKVKDGRLMEVGITCALCHSDVDDSVMAGIGNRLDGYPNRDLNTGAILSLSPVNGDPALQAVFSSWGPGRHDARFNQDGINQAVLIPPIYGLNGVPLETYTGDGPISYWNQYVAVTQMGGVGSFFEPRTGVFVHQSADQVSPNLPFLYEYQLTLEAPEPPEGSYDVVAAQRGKEVFDGVGTCSGCHQGPHYTDAGSRLHSPEETGMDPLAAIRGATGFYRTTPLRALWQHAPYFHDGSAATLNDVVEHYDSHLSLGLNGQEKQDLVEFLKSI